MKTIVTAFLISQKLIAEGIEILQEVEHSSYLPLPKAGQACLVTGMDPMVVFISDRDGEWTRRMSIDDLHATIIQVEQEESVTQNFLQNTHHKDEMGRPAGGVTTAAGLCIVWQNGPLGRGTERREPNGAFVETVIEAAKSRLEFYQGSPFKCEENQTALNYLNEALKALRSRTTRREQQGVEGTHGGQ